MEAAAIQDHSLALTSCFFLLPPMTSIPSFISGSAMMTGAPTITSAGQRMKKVMSFSQVEQSVSPRIALGQTPAQMHG